MNVDNAGLSNVTDVDRRSLALLDDETIFTSSGAGPAFASVFSNEDEQLHNAIEASLKGQSETFISGGSRIASRDNGHADSLLFDNEDPELTAGIAASLEAEQTEQVEAMGTKSGNAKKDMEVDVEDDMEEAVTVESEALPTAEEMRRARLARFGQ